VQSNELPILEGGDFFIEYLMLLLDDDLPLPLSIEEALFFFVWGGLGGDFKPCFRGFSLLNSPSP